MGKMQQDNAAGRMDPSLEEVIDVLAVANALLLALPPGALTDYQAGR